MRRRHRADDIANRAIARLIRADLIVIDDIGMLPVAADAAEALFRVVDAAHEQRSIALTSNIHAPGLRRADAQDAGHRDRRPGCCTTRTR
jgi:DNA replication protein DnaC